MSTLSYYIETNNDNVRVEYREINYVPNSVVWENGVNSFNNLEEVDPDIEGTPDYVRIGTSMFTYYMKYLVVPTRETKFTIHVLSNGSEDNVAVTYDVFSSFMQCTSIGSEITVLTKTNNKTSERTGTITIYSTYDSTDVLYINVYQEYIHIHLSLEDFIFESGGEITNGNIQNVEYEHLFNCLTNKNTPEKQELVIHVNVTGPRKKFFIKKITKFETIGELDNTYLYADGFYYRVKQKYVNGELVTYHDRVIVGSNGLVYDEFKYENDLDISVSSNKLTITNYGRCFLGEDAYYVLTLANADDYTETCKITIRYRETYEPIPPVPIVDDYLTFKALAPDSTVQLTKVGEPSDIWLVYSLDNGHTWNEYVIGQTISLVNLNSTVKFKGNNASLSSNGNNYYKFVFDGIISASGHITSLLNEACGNIPLTMYDFYNLFLDCVSLTTAPELPSMSLANSCYRGMFQGCTSLATAPVLPATTMSSYCYSSMFRNCSSLATAPELPATTLASYCYTSMLYGCASLTTAPELPATTLANYCYSTMFSYCTSLVTTPVLSATTLAQACYYYMFSYCVSLNSSSALPATSLYENCYRGMFYSCSALVTAPELPATTLANYCYYQMFNLCSSLVTAPELPATTLANYCYFMMFYGCTSLNNITCLATDISAPNCTTSWVYGVAANGTFTKAAGMNSWTTGTDGIPSGWMVEIA